MNESVLTPSTVGELQEIVGSHARVLPIGNRTKQPLSSCVDAALVSLKSISGITQYEPSEFTFTARAGTPVSEVAAALEGKRQYLPFDPMLVDAGATIGGTVASGLSGPGRFRYGGIRDFLLGVQLLSGEGKRINAGGKVVKNAAGFDIPKFMVGSMGRLGVMTELTFKVFPRPIATQTLRVHCESGPIAIDRMAAAAASRWELDAIDYRPGEQLVILRLAGPETALEAIAGEVRSLWGADVSPLDEAESFWQSVRELNWISDAPLVAKIPTTPTQLLRLKESNPTMHLHASVAGNLTWIALDRTDIDSLDRQLNSLKIPALIVRGSCERSRIGQWAQSEVATAIKASLDPPAKFPMLVEPGR